MVYVIQVSWQLASRIRTASWFCSQAVIKPVWHIPLLCVQRKTPDDGQRNCPKHAEFYSRNKFEKLVHLIGFIIRNVILSRRPTAWSLNKQHMREVSQRSHRQRAKMCKPTHDPSTLKLKYAIWNSTSPTGTNSFFGYLTILLQA